MNPVIKIFPSPTELAEALALEIVNKITETGNAGLLFSIALSGGNTPKLLFSVLGDKFADSVNWNNVHFFWVDERCVPPDNKDSNFGMTQEALFSKIRIPGSNIHRIKGEDNPEKESIRYSGELNNFIVKRNDLPYFNVVLLGIGEDGHTASIFPGNEYLFKSGKLCMTAAHPVSGQIRITLTGEVINNSENVFFMVTGKNKASIVEKILDDKGPVKQFPASFVNPADGNLFWFIDKDAGSLLK